MAQRAESLPVRSFTPGPRRSFARRIFGPDWQIAFPFIIPMVVLMLLFIAWPFLQAVYTSMTVRTLNRETRFVGLDNYIRLWQDPFYRQAVANTFVFTAGSISAKLLLGLCAALLLNAQKRWRNILTGLVLLPWIIPSVVQALAWKSILDPLFGGLNPILLSIGLIDKPLSFLADPKMAMICVIAVNVWAGIPFFTVNMLAGMQAIDKEQYEAAEIDGASAWERLIHITLPGLRYVVAVATLLSTIWTFNGFNVIYFITNGEPFGRTEILVTQAFKLVYQQRMYGVASAFSLIVFVILFIITMINNRVTRATEAYNA